MRSRLAILVLLVLSLAALANESPRIHDLGPIEVSEGNAFVILKMDRVAEDPDHGVRDLEFSIKDTELLWLSTVGAQVYLGLVDASWTGTETFTLVVCDPEGACAERSMSFTVHAVNDPPHLNIPDQLIPSPGAFPELDLSGFVEDSDDPFDGLHWQVHGADQLDLEILEGKLSVSMPSDDWTGVEMIEIRVCDASAACDAQVVTFARTEGSESELHRIGNGGFVLEAAGMKIGWDALFSIRATSEMTALMRAAEAPFDMDLLLVSNDSSYRCSPQIIADNMVANLSAHLIAPQSVVDAVLALAPEIGTERCVALELGSGETATLEAAGVRVRAAGYTAHPSRSHAEFAYAFELGESSFLYLGGHELDADFSGGANPFSGQPFDFAFISMDLIDGSGDDYDVHSVDASWMIPVCSSLRANRCGCIQNWGARFFALCFEETLQRRYLPSN